MRRFKYTARFSVGVVAGSSVLGMLIPPSAMLIIYAIVAEESVGKMFMAGIIPGIILSIAYALLIVFLSRVFPNFVGGVVIKDASAEKWGALTYKDIFTKLFPVVLLMVAVLGGIYGGITSPVEAGAVGALGALIIAVLKKRITWAVLWKILVETGYISATIMFLIIAASMYSRMLGIAALPTLFEEWLTGMELSLPVLMAVYVILLILLGTIIDTASIILIVVPLFLPTVEGYGASMVWFGIVTVVGAEVGLLTPPLGLSCFAIKSTLDDALVSLSDIFYGAAPFALTMLFVLVLLIAYPQLSLILVH
jgi:tripartite ATP-independent transporter DctM subunit